MLPVDQADDVQVRVDDDIARLEVGTADAKMTEGRVPGDE